MVELSHFQMTGSRSRRTVLRIIDALHLNHTCTPHIGMLSNDELPRISV